MSLGTNGLILWTTVVVWYTQNLLFIALTIMKYLINDTLKII